MNSSFFKKYGRWLAFGFPLVIYVLTLCPTVYWDDSGELITACYTLGIPHPPGHPLYALIGKLFTFLPVGSIAWRVNFMSAFFGALSCLFVYKIIEERFEGNPWSPLAALGGALYVAFASTVWDQATIGETSTLHNSFMMLLTLLAFRLASGNVIWKDERRSFWAFGFLYGFSLTNHVAGVFFFPAFAYIFILTFRKRLFNLRLIAGSIVAFGLGLLVYAYLPIRSMADPPIDWGDPETLNNFLWVVTARQYASNLVTKPTLYLVTTNLVAMGKHLLRDFTVIGCVFGGIGAWALIRKERNFLVFSGLVVAVLFSIGLNNAFISAYFIPALALIGVWIGVGLGCSMDRLARLSEHIRPLPAARAAKAVGCGVLAASFCLPLAIHFRDMDRSQARYALQYGEETLERFPEGSVFFADDDHQIFILWYLLFCEHRRPDVIVATPSWLVHGGAELLSSIVQQYPTLVLPAEETVSEYTSRAEDYAEPWEKTYMGIQAFMDANYAKRPIYWGMIRLKLTFFQHLIPDGLTYRYSAQPVSLDDSVLQKNRNFWRSITESAQNDPAIHRDPITLRVYPLLLNNQGLMFRHLGRDEEARWAIELALALNPEFAPARYNLGNLEARARRYDNAIREYERTIRSDPYFALAYNELGNVQKNLGRFDEADRAYEMALKIDPAFHQAITALGQLRLLLGRKEDAIREFQRALEIEPNDPVALRGLASLYLEKGNLPESRALLDRALKVEADSAAALLMLAKYHSIIGDEEGSAAALSRAIEAGGRLYLHMALNDPNLNRIAQSIIQGEAQQ